MPVELLKRAAKSALATRPGWIAAAPLRARGTVALMYHRIHAGEAHFPGMAADRFHLQMAWVAKHCTPVRPEEALDAARRASRIRPPVVVTFDDGFRDYHDVAYPILRDLRIPAAVFLATDFMDRGGLLWTEMLHWAGMRSPNASVRLPWDPAREAGLATGAQRVAFLAMARLHLKGAPDADRRRWVAELLDSLQAPPAEAELGRQMLSWDQVRAIREGTTFGGHSHTHPILSQLGPADLEREIRTCRERIEAETGEAPRCFAYPNGRAVDFDERAKDALRRHGFEVAFSTEEGIIEPGADPLALRRQHSGGATAADVAAIVARA
ncbi:MAG: polysaccharide deacetylase family protein [Lysobacter sp.]|nr:polysaccharide deacetylase family protein [Lysobacter sp.]